MEDIIDNRSFSELYYNYVNFYSLINICNIFLDLTKLIMSAKTKSVMLSVLLLSTMGITPDVVEAGPLTTGACVLGCLGTFCTNAAGCK